MKKIELKSKSLMALAFAVPLALAACGAEDGPAENAGEQIDEMADQVGEKMSDTMESAGDAVEEAGDKVEDATQ